MEGPRNRLALEVGRIHCSWKVDSFQQEEISSQLPRRIQESRFEKKSYLRIGEMSTKVVKYILDPTIAINFIRSDNPGANNVR